MTLSESSYQSAEHREFAKRLQLVQSRLYSYLHMLVRDMNDADDLLQQTSIVLWRKYDQFDPSRDFFNWACGVARMEAKNFLRKRANRRVMLTDQLDGLLIASLNAISDDDREDRREALVGCVEKLGDRDRELVRECYTRCRAVREVADNLSRTPQSVHNSLKRVRGALLDCIRRSLASEGRPA